MISTKAALLASCVLSLMLASCAERSQMPAHAYEGTITEVIHMPGLGKLMSGGNLSKKEGTDKEGLNKDTEDNETGSAAAMGALANVGLKMYVRENAIAYDVSVLGGLITMHSIIDRNARTLTMLLPNHSAMVMDLRKLDSARNIISDSLQAHNGLFDSLQAALPQPTGKHQTIHGLETEEYRGAKGDIETDLWLSDNEKLKAFDVVRDAFLGRGTEGSGGLDQIFGMMRPIAGKIPVKFETKLNGEVLASGELTDITEEKLDDALFTIPKDYTIINGDSARATKPQQRHFTAP